MIKVLDNYIKIDTKNTSLLLKKYDNRLILLHYGKKIHDASSYDFLLPKKIDGHFGSNDDYRNALSVFSFNGEGSNKEPLVLLSKKDGTFVSRFNLVDISFADVVSSPLPLARNKENTIVFTYVDEISNATLKQYFSTFNDSDVISTHIEIKNTSDDLIYIKKLFSLQLDFAGDSANITSFDGTWNYERINHKTQLKSGRFEIDSKLGFSSNTHNPYMIVEVNGKFIGINLLWSGNHKEIVEISPYCRIRVQNGLNDYCFDYELKSSETICSPESIFAIEENTSDLSIEMQRFAQNHIINPNFAYKEKPVLINNWEGTYFDFNYQKLKGIIDSASDCGIEMFVLDDGWFGSRNSEESGLGDWEDNAEKTGGLKSLSKYIHSLGMKFGLWVEPEMIQVNSRLYKSHPDFAMKIDGVRPIERRNQLCVDMCNLEARKYLTKTLIGLFIENNIDYVKWDCNRSMIDIHSNFINYQGNYFYDYFVNLYAMLDEITKAVPNVLFESCASGGNRYDLGMLYFMPQNWASDNTNAYHRLFIQEGTLSCYPVSSFGSHINDNYYSHPKVSLESKFNVCAMGAFGYELDPTKISAEQIEIIKEQIVYFKKHRTLFQFGDYYKIGESFVYSSHGGWCLVSKAKDEAIAVIIDKEITGSVHNRPVFHFEGLDPCALYLVEMRSQSNLKDGSLVEPFEAYGDALMHGGIEFDALKWSEVDFESVSSFFASRMFYLKKIK